MLLLDVKGEGRKSEKVERRCFIYSLERPVFLCEVDKCLEHLLQEVTGRQSPAKPQNLPEILRNYKVGLPCPHGHCMSKALFASRMGPGGPQSAASGCERSLSGVSVQSHPTRRLSLAQPLLNQSPACMLNCV